MKESIDPEKFYSESTHQKNLDLMKLLVSFDKFQEVVKSTREYMDIPSDGVPLDDESIKKWSFDSNKRTENIIRSVAFQASLKSLYEKSKGKQISSKEYKSELKALHFQLPVNYLTWTIDFIIERFNLPKNFTYFLRQYIVFNKLSAPSNNFAIVTRTDLTGEQHESVEVYAKLNNDELVYLKNYVNSHLEYLPTITPLKNLETNLKVEDWVKNRERLDVISGESYVMNNIEIAENLLGGKEQAKKVYDIVDGLKEQRHKRFNQFIEDSETT